MLGIMMTMAFNKLKQRCLMCLTLPLIIAAHKYVLMLLTEILLICALHPRHSTKSHACRYRLVTLISYTSFTSFLQIIEEALASIIFL